MSRKIGLVVPLVVGLIGCGASVESGAGSAGAAGAATEAGAGGSSALGQAGSPGHSALAGAGSFDSGSSARGGTAPNGGTTAVEPARGEPTCPTHEPLNSHDFSSTAEEQQAFVGRWMQCSQQGLGPDDAAGIKVAADGKFTILVRSATGELVPGVGVLHEGRVVVTSNDVEFQTASYTELSRMLFSDETPYRMYAFNTDFIGYDYIRVSADGVD